MMTTTSYVLYKIETEISGMVNKLTVLRSDGDFYSLRQVLL